MANQRIFIINSNSIEKEYSEKLYNRIKTNYSQYSVSLWSEERYKNNKHAINELDKIIFFGNARNNDECAKEDKLRWKFNKYEMKYGWAGNICAVYATGNTSNFSEFYGSFRKYCEKMHTKYSDVPIPGHNILDESFAFFAKKDNAGYRCQYASLLREFMDGGGFKAFMAKANPDAPAFTKIVEQLPELSMFPSVHSTSHWDILESRDGYQIQENTDNRSNLFRIVNGNNEIIAWGKRDYINLGIIAFLALFEETIFEVIETKGENKNTSAIYKTKDSLKPIDELIKDAEMALVNKNSTLIDSSIPETLINTIPEVFMAFIGGGLGAACSFAALYFMGNVVGLSAAGITSGLAALGAIVGGGMVAGIFVMAAPIALLSTFFTVVYAEVNKNELKKAKDRLLQKAIEMQHAILIEMKTDINAAKKRADYLNFLNEALRRAIADLQADNQVS